MNNTNNKLILFQHCFVILSSSTSARMGPENPQGLLELNLPMKIRNGAGFGNVNDFFFLKERGAKGGGWCMPSHRPNATYSRQKKI